MVYFYNSRNAKHIAAIAGHAPFPPLPTFYFRVRVNSCLPCSCSCCTGNLGVYFCIRVDHTTIIQAAKIKTKKN